MTELVRTVLDPVLDPGSRTFLPAILLSVGIAAVAARGAGLRALLSPSVWLHRSSVLDGQILLVRQLWSVLGLAPRLATPLAFATILVRGLDRLVGQPAAPSVPLPLVAAAYSLVLFVAWDASRYAVHRLMHAWEPLWRFHQVHHSAEVLTPMTFHRVHPVESVVYEIRGVLVTGTLAGLAFWVWRGDATEWTIAGVNAIGLVLNGLSGNLRHSHVWWSWGRLERVLLSPAQHQLHHAEDPASQRANYGTWLSVWDRLAGSLVLAPAAAPSRYGLRPEDRNHRPDDLLSALFAPFAAFRPAFALALALVSPVARADDPPADPPLDPPAPDAPPPDPAPPASVPSASAPAGDDDEAGMSVIVESKRGVPNEPGSAHVIGEAELQRYRYDDIGRVITKVPGVYVRTEDGYGLRPNIGMRGASSDRSSKVTVLEDGVPLVPAPYAAPAAYYFPMTSRMVGIEVFKGASAIRHGPQTIGGAVNLLTRPVPTETSGALDVGLGTFSTYKLNGWGAVANERAGLLLDVASLSTDGFKRLDGGGPTGFERQDFMLEGRWSPAGALAQSLTLKLGYGRERSNETYLGLNADDFAADPYRRCAASQDDLMRWKRGQAELSYKVLGERFDLRAVAYFHRLHRIWSKLNRFAGGPDLHDLLTTPASGQSAVYLAILRGEEDTTSTDQQLMIGTNDRSFDSGGVTVEGHHRAGGEKIRNELEIGARLHVDEVVRYQTEDAFEMRAGRLLPVGSETLVALDSSTEALALSGWIADDIGLGPLRVSPGARVEAIRTAAGTRATGPEDPRWSVIALPGVGVLGEIRPWLTGFAGTHRGFSPVAPGSDADARPETAWSYEAGLRATPGETHAEAIGFLSDYDNITGQCTLSSGCEASQVDTQYNGGAAWVWGLEALLSHRLWVGDHHLGGEVTYTWTETRFRTSFVSAFPQYGSVDAGDSLPYVPAHQGSAQLFDEHERGTIAIAARGRSAMRDVAGQGEMPKNAAIPATVQLDVSGELHVTPRVSLWANATNVLGTATIESWRPFGARPAAPRQAMIGVKVH